jgi:hypothetical protein
LRQLPGDHELLAAAQARARSLLAVAQRRIEDGDLVGHYRRLYRRTGSGEKGTASSSRGSVSLRHKSEIS